MIGTIPLDYKISGTKIFIPFKAICSVTDKEFSGDVVIEYHPKKRALEYVDAERAVNEIARNKITAEELAHEVFSQVKESIKPKYLKIFIDIKHSDAHRPAQVWIEN
jgi:NADPH-dependent 7-cyano-7-deazaguanine reductase QueF